MIRMPSLVSILALALTGTAGLWACQADTPPPSIQSKDAPADSTQPASNGAPAAAVDEGQGRSRFGRVFQARKDVAADAKLMKQLEQARAAAEASPDDPEALIWYGRRLGYLWRMREAIAVYTKGIQKWPDNAAFYRHRGHRYISVRAFDKAVADLQRASELIRGKDDVVEQDGMPNARNIPLSTLGFNIYYHLGVAHYAMGDYHASILAFKQAMIFGRKYADNVVACIDWCYLANIQIGRPTRAEKLLSVVNANMEIIENHAYFKRVMVYKGLMKFEEVWKEGDNELQGLTLGYGLARWLMYQGREEEAKSMLRRLIASEYWPAFGVVAAEAEWDKMKTSWGKP
ncbi:MAG: tetratricopeptide repeat protein [Phycisphaerae bacterium]